MEEKTVSSDKGIPPPPVDKDVRKYQQVLKIGHGTYGEVFKAVHRTTGEVVALKKVSVKEGESGVPLNSAREVQLLDLLKPHPNIVNLKEVCTEKGQEQGDANDTPPPKRNRVTFYLVLEFCDHDLVGILNCDEVHLTPGEIKNISQQMLNGLAYIHSNNILHRDIKPANLLLTKDGVLKIADFGLGRRLRNRRYRYTNKVVTLEYRAPELLLGGRNYGPGVDVWAAGCIIAEMYKGSIFLPGASEVDQLKVLIRKCGSISSEVWPGVEKLDLYKKLELELPQDQPRQVKETMGKYIREDPEGLDLLDKMLTLDPSKRPDADECLKHTYFWSDPPASDLRLTLEAVQRSLFAYFLEERVD